MDTIIDLFELVAALGLFAGFCITIMVCGGWLMQKIEHWRMQKDLRRYAEKHQDDDLAGIKNAVLTEDPGLLMDEVDRLDKRIKDRYRPQDP